VQLEVVPGKVLQLPPPEVPELEVVPGKVLPLPLPEVLPQLLLLAVLEELLELELEPHNCFNCFLPRQKIEKRMETVCLVHEKPQLDTS
jgi:hypothetical protein